MFCADRDNRLVGQLSQRLNLVLTNAQLENAMRTGINASLSVPIEKHHAFDVKVIAYNFDADVLGSVFKSIQR